MLCVIREIYESGSAGFVSSLLSSVENYINLQSRDLDSVQCAALRFTLQHCTAASLSLSVDLHTRGRSAERYASIHTSLPPQVSLLFSISLSQVCLCVHSVAFWVMSKPCSRIDLYLN